MGLLLATTSAEAKTDWCQYGDSTTLLLVDRTTEYDHRDKKILVDGVGPLFDDLGPGDRLIVKSVAGDWTKGKRLTSLCHASCPDADGFIGWLFSDCASTRAGMALRRQKAKIRKVLRQLVTQPASSPSSDIALTIAESVQSLRTAANRGDIPELRRVALFSDLIENTPYLSASEIKRLAPDKALARWREHDAVPDLSGGNIAVDVWGFGRDHKHPREPLPAKVRARVEQSWHRLFQAAGARSVTITHTR